MVVYKITNLVNNKIYIGQTTQPIKVRLMQHKRKVKSILGQAISKYGIDNFEIIELAKAETLEQLNDLEIEFIAILNALDKNIGYNIYSGGLNYKKTEEHKAKISAAHKGKIKSPEHLQKMKENRVYLPVTEETKLKIRQNHTHRRHSPEQRRQISERQIGTKKSEETKQKCREAALKRPPISKETREKMSNSQKLRNEKLRKECQSHT